MLRSKKAVGVVALFGFAALGALLAAAERPDAPGPGSSSKELVEAARQAYELRAAGYRARLVPLEDIYAWSRRWLMAEWDLGAPGDGKVNFARDHEARMVELEKSTKQQFNEGIASAAEMRAATYYRIEAGLMLARAGG